MSGVGTRGAMHACLFDFGSAGYRIIGPVCYNSITFREQKRSFIHTLPPHPSLLILMIPGGKRKWK